MRQSEFQREMKLQSLGAAAALFQRLVLLAFAVVTVAMVAVPVYTSLASVQTHLQAALGAPLHPAR